MSKFLDPDYLMGRRFEFTSEFTGEPAAPDFTCVAVDPEARKVRIHAADGGRWWIDQNYIDRALRGGVIQESSEGPFVL